MSAQAIEETTQQNASRIMDQDNVFAIVAGDRSIVFDLRHKDDYIQQEIVKNKTFYEKDVLEEVGRLLVEDGAVCDVGANIGNHSLYFSIVLGRRVLAFEPLRAAYEQLVRNVRINRCEDSVSTFNVALGATTATGSMEGPAENLGASKFVFSGAGETKLVRLDDAIPDDTKVALIKIDVEGLEHEVLQGAARTIARCLPLLVVEAQDHPAYLRIAQFAQAVDYVPISMKGKTATFFFMHRSKWKAMDGLAPFLIRNDLDYVSRRLHGQLDRIARTIGALPGQAGLQKAVEDVAAPFTSLANRLAHHFEGPEDLRVAISQLSETLAEMHARISALGDARQAEQNDLRVAISQLSETLVEMHARIAALGNATHAEQNDLRATFERLSAPLGSITTQVTSLAGQLQEGLARVHEQFIVRLEQGLHALPRAAAPEDLRTAVESLSAPIETLSARFEERTGTLLQAISNVPSDVHAHAKAVGVLVKDLEATHRSSYDRLEGKLNVLQGAEAELGGARKDIAELEGEVARLLIAVQTERARAEFLSRRLHTLYTSGPRPIVGKLIGIARTLAFGKINPYESWADFQRRLEVRVKREVDSFRKMHSRLNSQSRRPAPEPTESAARTTKLASPSRGSHAPFAPQHPGATRKGDRIRIGIASIRKRKQALSQVVDALYDQADELIIYLNDYEGIPDFLQRDKIKVVHGKGDVGDRGKFYEVEKFEGYILTCDDDILYPPYYVKHCIDAIERYGRKAAVGWHGSVFKTPFHDYYSPESRRVFSFRSGRPEDVAVHVLGTGCTAFHSTTLKVRYDDFKTPNMADVYFALLGQRQKVPFVVIKHDAGEALPIDIPEDTAIHRESMQNTGSQADTRALQNQLVKEWSRWQAALPLVANARQLCTVAYVGRIEKERWKKGGILKSSHLIMESLRALGHRVIPVEISQKDDQLVGAIRDAHIVWIYPGDPERPDFVHVEQLIASAAAAGKQVYVNLSYNLKRSRTDWIVRHLTDWRKAYGTRVKACLFSYAAMEDHALASVRSNLVSIPKSIDFDSSIRAAFRQTEGIFLGDLQKLLNRELVGGEIEEWLNALRKALPGVKLYAVRQYGGKIDRDLGLTILPYTTGTEWEEWIAQRRVACCLTPHATYEMIPVEAAGVGVPVIYRPMPQSHSEALSFAGIRVESPQQFALACQMLYHDATVWQMYSDAGRLRAQSLHIDCLGAAIHTHLLLGRV